MFITALFTVAEIWNQPRCPSTDEWPIYIVEYYSAISFAGKWMELAIIKLSKISQTEKDKYCMSVSHMESSS
jgi:hypothetical protein